MKRLARHIMKVLILLVMTTTQAQVDSDSINARRRAIDYFCMEATSLMEQERLDEAFEMIEHSLALDPASTELKFQLIPYHMALGNDSTVRCLFEEIIEEEPGNEIYNYGYARFCQENGERKKAIAIYEKFLENTDSKSDVYRELYTLYTGDGKYEKALDILNKAEEFEGYSIQTTLEKIQIYFYLGRTDEGLGLAKHIVAENPDDTRYKTLLGNVYNMTEEYDKAEEIYLQVLSENPDDAYVMSELVSLYAMTENTEGYNNYIGRLLKNEKVESSERLEYLARHLVYLQSEDSTNIGPFMHEILQLPFDQLEHHELYAEFLEYFKPESEELRPIYEKITELDPENIGAIVKLLTYAIECDDIPAVLKYADNALLYLPGVIELYYYKGIAHRILGCEEENLEVFRQGIEKRDPESDPNSVSILFTELGNTYHRFGMRNECYAAYDSALVYDPYNIEALNNYSYYLSLEGRDLQKAMEMSQKTIEKEPKNNTYLDTYAWILFKSGRYEEARAYAEKILSSEEDLSATILHHIGDIYAKCGDMEKAVLYWMKASEAGDETKILDKKIKKRKYYRGAEL